MYHLLVQSVYGGVYDTIRATEFFWRTQIKTEGLYKPRDISKPQGRENVLGIKLALWILKSINRERNEKRNEDICR